MPTLLSLIWTTALALAALAIAALAFLLAARLWRVREEVANLGRRSVVAKELLFYAVTGAERPQLDLGNHRERQFLVEAALENVEILREPARTRLVALLREVGMDRRLRRLARRGNIRERMLALEGLSLLPEAATVACLIEAERCGDLRIWLTALRTRCLIGAGPDMLGLLRLADRPGARRSPIMQELVSARATANLPEALRTLREGLPALTRVVLVRALGDTKRYEALDPLKLALYNPDAAVRCAAAGALGELGYDAAADSLVRACQDSDWRVRLRASEAIGRLGLWRRRDSLTPLLHDPVWWVRLRAEEAMGRLAKLGPCGRVAGEGRPLTPRKRRQKANAS